jgi:hypothetical protein
MARVLLEDGSSVDLFEYRKQLEAQKKQEEKKPEEAKEPESAKEKVEKPLSKMNVAELTEKAISMGASEGSLSGMKKAELKEVISKLEEADSEDAL